MTRREALARVVNEWRKRHNLALIMLWAVGLESYADYCTLSGHSAWMRYYGLIVAILVAGTVGRIVERRYWQPQITRLEQRLADARQASLQAFQVADRRIAEISAELERRTP